MIAKKLCCLVNFSQPSTPNSPSSLTRHINCEICTKLKEHDCLFFFFLQGIIFIYDTVVICKLDPHYIITQRSGMVQLKVRIVILVLWQVLQLTYLLCDFCILKQATPIQFKATVYSLDKPRGTDASVVWFSSRYKLLGVCH